jgi:hypothetical protein
MSVSSFVCVGVCACACIYECAVHIMCVCVHGVGRVTGGLCPSKATVCTVGSLLLSLSASLVATKVDLCGFPQTLQGRLDT